MHGRFSIIGGTCQGCPQSFSNKRLHVYCIGVSIVTCNMTGFLTANTIERLVTVNSVRFLSLGRDFNAPDPFIRTLLISSVASVSAGVFLFRLCH